MVRNNVAAEDEVGVLERLLLRARSATDRYGDPTRRQQRMATLAAQAFEQIHACTPGSDRQLAWVRHWVSCARAEDDVAAARRFLDGELDFDGVRLDTDLRWHVVLQLAAVGALDEDEIDDEEQRDPTDLGERNAASARASRPDRDAKDVAWQRLLDEEGLSHTVGRQLWGGLFQLHQREVLDGYDQRYLDALDRVWDERSIDWAIEWSEGCFPHPLASPGLRDAVQRVLDRDDLGGPLRRVLLEQQDTLLRTLRARALDG
jgi:aminopeptidase N